jgi:hypothetical protein
VAGQRTTPQTLVKGVTYLGSSSSRTRRAPGTPLSGHLAIPVGIGLNVAASTSLPADGGPRRECADGEALQRQAAVIVEKSLQEGFGLGATEGQWKARPLVTTRVGSHGDQIEVMGLLVAVAA